jgi:hypothetical protein
MILIQNLEGNNISDIGCSFLIRAAWPSLQKLKLSMRMRRR